jgi:hypothetical protein
MTKDQLQKRVDELDCKLKRAEAKATAQSFLLKVVHTVVDDAHQELTLAKQSSDYWRGKYIELNQRLEAIDQALNARRLQEFIDSTTATIKRVHFYEH